MRNNKKRRIILISYRSRLRLLLSAGMIIILVIILSNELPSSKTWTHWSTPLSGKMIVIDPGHGGRDGGAVSRDGLLEKDINLLISFHLRDYLQQAGALVVMTREDDRDLADPETRGSRKRQDLHRRVEFVKRKESDVLVSIHMNSIPAIQWSGAQTFYYPNQHKDNKLLATFIQDELKLNLENTDRDVKTIKTIYLLKSVEIPAVLVEAGFLSNPMEARLLANEEYQKKVAASIYRGILRYLSGEKLHSGEKLGTS